MANDDTAVTYNAAGQLATYATSDNETSAVRKYDGAGCKTNRVQSNFVENETGGSWGTKTSIKFARTE